MQKILPERLRLLVLVWKGRLHRQQLLFQEKNRLRRLLHVTTILFGARLLLNTSRKICLSGDSLSRTSTSLSPRICVFNAAILSCSRPVLASATDGSCLSAVSSAAR